jgi:hypothetical protein
LKEFIEGAARLRGGAKALDIWRLETKAQAAQAERIHGFTMENLQFWLLEMVHDGN